MGNAFKFKSLNVLILIITFIFGVILGIFGYNVQKLLHTKPLFNYNSSEIIEIRVYGTVAKESKDGFTVIFTDSESIEKIITLLNSFTYHYSEVQTEELLGWESRMTLYTANGASIIGFSTNKNHEHDVVSKGCSGHMTFYMTDPGYLWEIAEMCSNR